MAKFSSTPAVILTSCNECDEPIFPGEMILWATYRGTDGKGGLKNFRVPLCAECGTLYIESQEYGSNGKDNQVSETAK